MSRIAPGLAWLRHNLFRSIGDAIITVIVGGLALYALYRFGRFVFVTGRWEIARANLPLLLTRSWPADQLWRITVTVVGLAAIAGVLAGFLARRRREVAALSGEVEVVGLPARLVDVASRTWPAALAVLLLLALARTSGPWLLALAGLAGFAAGRLVGPRLPGSSGAAVVGVGLLYGLAMIWLLINGRELDDWGGLMLNLFLAAFSITLCFPVGVLMALGRRSPYPVVRGLSTAYIELFRGVPLISLLLMSQQALGFFLPQSLVPGQVVRAIVVFVLFTGAYVAEIVRGGLQSVPTGQIEAGRALGLSPVSITRRIVLPQALRNVIPALVGQFISLFKDTVLAGAVIAVPDLLGAAQAATSQEDFVGQGLIAESLVFVLLIFWAGSYTMSNESQRLEARLGVGQR